MDRGTLIILLVVAGVLLLIVLSGFKTVPDGSKGTEYRFRRGPQRVESGRTYVLPGVDDFVVEPEEQHGVVGVSGNAVTSDRHVVHVQLQVRFKVHSDGMSDATDFVQRQAAAHLHLVIASMTLAEARRATAESEMKCRSL
jgi:regulator of protease activity HflC (stomatin/prohibitin superfamily)